MTTQSEAASVPQPLPWWTRLGNWVQILKKAFAYFGPAFVVSVGYMDPGNWATDLDGGSRFAYRLIWVLLASNLMAILLQIMAAKLGIATGRDLAQLCRERYPRALSRFLWLTAEFAMIATDLAEFLGSALGIHLLFHIPLLTAVIITGCDVLLLLALEHYGYRVVELAIVSLVAVVGFGYLYEIFLARPDLLAVARGTFVPFLNRDSVYVAIGMLGATVMPHNLYLHSALIQTRRREGDEAHNRRVYRYACADSIVALNAAFFVNAAILIMSAAVFYKHGVAVASIEEAHKTLAPLLGSASAFVFAIALLASGLSSSTTGTLAGQVVMEGFLNIRWQPWVRRVVTRLLTMAPAIIAIAAGVDPLKIMVLSQAALSFQLPFAIIPLLQFTRDRELMGRYANGALTNALASLITAVIIGLNLYLLYATFT